MIDTELFFKKHRNIESKYLVKIIDTTLQEFPRQIHNLKLHMNNLNFGEAMYLADFIEDSFAFIFGDVELGKCLRGINEAARNKDQEKLKNLYQLLEKQEEEFLNGIVELKKKHF